jgi:hypothetical protein
MVGNRRVARQWRKSFYTTYIIMLKISGKVLWVDHIAGMGGI